MIKGKFITKQLPRIQLLGHTTFLDNYSIIQCDWTGWFWILQCWLADLQTVACALSVVIRGVRVCALGCSGFVGSTVEAIPTSYSFSTPTGSQDVSGSELFNKYFQLSIGVSRTIPCPLTVLEYGFIGHSWVLGWDVSPVLVLATFCCLGSIGCFGFALAWRIFRWTRSEINADKCLVI